MISSNQLMLSTCLEMRSINGLFVSFFVNLSGWTVLFASSKRLTSEARHEWQTEYRSSLLRSRWFFSYTELLQRRPLTRDLSSFLALASTQVVIDQTSC